MLMRTLGHCLSVYLFLLCLVLSGLALPGTAHAARIYRIGYIEAGPHWLFTKTYTAFRQSLDVDNNAVTAEYPPELHVSLNWQGNSAELEARARALFLAHPDLIVAAGTDATQALLKVNDGSTPILGIAISDPVESGFMKSPTESAVKNFNCEIIPDRWKSMFRAFHDVVGFKKLGIMYSSDVLMGRIQAGAKDALFVGKQKGFEVVEVVIPNQSTAACMQGIEALHQKGVDAFFIGPLNCFDWSRTDPTSLINALNDRDISTFARDGSPWVQGGAFMGFSTWNFAPRGNNLAAAAAQMLRGTPPNEINMAAVSEPLIALNVDTAFSLGLDLPFGVWLAADEVFEETRKPDMD